MDTTLFARRSVHRCAFVPPVRRRWWAGALAVLALLGALWPSGGRASVVGWGTNDFGQLTIPTNVAGARAVASGYWHGLAVTFGRSVAAWGLNQYGQATPPAGLSNIVGLAGGQAHSLALSSDGLVTGWGVRSNDFDPNPALNSYFGQADIPPGLTNVAAVAAGAFHSLALDRDGRVHAWGYNAYGQGEAPPGPGAIAAIACGGYFNVALGTDGTVLAWGDNFYGQTLVPPGLTGVVAVAAGGFHALALKADGSVVAWGDNSRGQADVPGGVTNVLRIAAGYLHSVAVLQDGSVLQWGDAQAGQGTVPSTLRSPLALAAGYAHTLALTDDTPRLAVQPTNVVTRTNRAVTFLARLDGLRPMTGTWWRRTVATPTPTPFTSLVLSNTIVNGGFSGGTLQALVTNLPSGPKAQFTLNLIASGVTTNISGDYWLVATNAYGAVTSQVATLAVLIPPTLVTQPAGVAAAVGAAVTLSVQAAGSPPLRYDWSRDGTLLPEAGSTNVLFLPAVTTNDAGSYRVVVSNPVGAVTSAVAVVTVDGAPVISAQPVDAAVAAGASHVFAATAQGGVPLAYQWFFQDTAKNVTALPDRTNATCRIEPVQLSDEGSYFMVAGNSYGTATTLLARLTVLRPPSLVQEPAGVVTQPGRAVAFSPRLDGTPPLRGTWWRRTVDNTDATALVSVVFSNTIANASFSGGTLQALVTNLPSGPKVQFTLNLTAAGVTTNISGDYWLVVTNAQGAVTSQVATLAVLVPPTLLTQPAGVATNAGSAVTLGVQASGSEPLRYDWSRDGTLLVEAGSTNVLFLPAVTTNDAGSYRVVVSNPVGAVTSAVAVVTVDGAPVISAQPVDAAVAAGASHVFAAAALGEGPLAYQWFFQDAARNVTALLDRTNATCRIEPVQLSDEGSYFMVAGNSYGTATSTLARLTVLRPPSLVQEPAGVVTQPGRAVAFTPRLDGTLPMRGTWWRRTVENSNATLITSVVFSNTIANAGFSGGTLQALVTNLPAGPRVQFTLNLFAAGLTTNVAGEYWLVATNVHGAVTSQVATLAVLIPPSLVSQPVGVATNLGSPVTLAVQAAGDAPLRYDWHRDGVALAEAGSTNLLHLPAVTTNDAGAYRVVVSNPVGSVTSEVARVTVLYNGSSTAPQIWLMQNGLAVNLEAGRNYRLQASTNLFVWTDVTNFMSQSSLILFTNLTFTNLDSTFYRVVTP